MARALEDVTLNDPKVPLVANVTATPVSDSQQIRDLLIQQVTGRVRWRSGIEWMAEQRCHGVLGNRRGQGAFRYDQTDQQGGCDTQHRDFC